MGKLEHILDKDELNIAVNSKRIENQSNIRLNCLSTSFNLILYATL